MPTQRLAIEAIEIKDNSSILDPATQKQDLGLAFFVYWDKNVFFLAECLFLRTFVGHFAIKHKVYEKILVCRSTRNCLRNAVLFMWRKRQ